MQILVKAELVLIIMLVIKANACLVYSLVPWFWSSSRSFKFWVFWAIFYNTTVSSSTAWSQFLKARVSRPVGEMLSQRTCIISLIAIELPKRRPIYKSVIGAYSLTMSSLIAVSSQNSYPEASSSSFTLIVEFKIVLEHIEKSSTRIRGWVRQEFEIRCAYHVVLA